jgi:inulin fructotransferase (DFA-I-forming)
MVGLDVRSASGESAFDTQVDALLATAATEALDIVTVLVEPSSSRNTILDSGTEAQTILDRTVNAFRPTPDIGSSPALSLPRPAPRAE